MKQQNVEALRKSELAIIHVAKKQLALEDDEYRSILLSITGKQSAAELDWQGRKRLLDHFKKIGFKVKAKTIDRTRPAVGQDRQARIGKIEALLAHAQRPWSYADAMAKNICKIDSIAFCKPEHLAKIIAALTYDAKRHSRGQ